MLFWEKRYMWSLFLRLSSCEINIKPVYLNMQKQIQVKSLLLAELIKISFIFAEKWRNKIKLSN